MGDWLVGGGRGGDKEVGPNWEEGGMGRGKGVGVGGGIGDDEEVDPNREVGGGREEDEELGPNWEE